MNRLGYGVAFAIGAAFMYGFDPQSGRRRRARIQNAAAHLLNTTVRSARKASLDSEKRLQGALIRLERLFSAAEVADDEVLAERVRSRMGRYCSHPGAIAVSSHAGVVGLRGRIPAAEAASVIRQVRRVAGVAKVSDALERRDSPADGSTPDEGPSRVRSALPWRTRWPISFRWAAGGGGAALVVSGLLRRGLLGGTLAAVGSGLVLRATRNRPLSVLFGGGACGERGIDVSKTLTVEAPIEHVFAAFVAFENFPKFMRHVRRVRRTGDRRWHWIVEGPSGFPFEWEAIVTELQPLSRVRWKSTEGAAIRNHGEARFERVSDLATRLTIRLGYEPPLGIAGHAVARLLGADPKRELDDDMIRFKSLFETAKRTAVAVVLH